MKQNSVVELLEHIIEKPGMYIGKRCPVRLQMFVQGWLYERDHVFDMEIIHRISEIIKNKYHIKGSHLWSEILLFYSEDSVDAFNKFKIIFEKAVNEQE